MVPDFSILSLAQRALAEDLGSAGDLTSNSVIPQGAESAFRIVAREPGVVSGVRLVEATYVSVDPRVAVEVLLADGSAVVPGDVVAVVSGPTGALLTGERVALNFLGHLSGVATATATIAQAISHTSTRITCTRKTTPGLRAVEKAAVVHGGGVNHRFGLYDAVMIKDNHIAAAGSIREVIRRARAGVGHLVKIEVEVDTLEQLSELLLDPVDVVLLDNMRGETLYEAVRMVDGRMITEASGRITAQTAPAIAESGVDLLSAGWITHSAPTLDLGLDS